MHPGHAPWLSRGGVALAVVTLAVSLPHVFADPVYHLPDAELLSGQFGKLPGYSTQGSTSTYDGRTDVAGPGVVYAMTLSGGDNGKIGFGEPAWPLDLAAGLDPDPGVPGGCEGHPNSSLAAYTSYEMWVTYLSGPVGSDINISLILNTGLTGPSGFPKNDSSNDTFWAGPWTTLALGETEKLVLNFSGAEAWNIYDNKAPHTGGGLHWTNGGTYAINDRDRHEISNIGLQIADFDGDAFGSQITLHLNVPEPLSMAFMASAFVGVVAWRRRHRRGH
jgi:hypothetical protein